MVLLIKIAVKLDGGGGLSYLSSSFGGSVAQW